MTIWLTMAGVGLFTYATRLSFILLFGRVAVPLWLRRALRFVPPAVLCAIVFPEALLVGGQLEINAGNARLLASLVAAVTAWKTRNIAVTFVLGMATLLLFESLA